MKNSWGADWGENGYIRIKRGVPKDGECGIKDEPSYPIVKVAPSKSTAFAAFSDFVKRHSKSLDQALVFDQATAEDLCLSGREGRTLCDLPGELGPH